MLRRGKQKLLLGLLALGVGLASVAVITATGRKPSVISLEPGCKVMFVKVTQGDLWMSGTQVSYYMHRFYVRSASLSPMSAEKFEQLEDLNIYRNALRQGTVTVCERSVTGSSAVFWVGYDSTNSLSCVGALSLQDQNGQALTLSQAEDHAVKNSTRHIWSAVSSGLPQSTRQYTLVIDNRKILVFTAP